jgi:site-specific recombinase XerC
MITIQPREPGPRCAPSAPGDMTCVTPRTGNRHTADHHQHETSAPESARQNRYTNPLHTASADRSHTYVSHLIEDGTDPLFVQWQAGHSWASTTATYTTVGQDARNRMLRAALARAYQGEDGN